MSTAQQAESTGARFEQTYRSYWPHTVRFISRQVRATDQHAIEDLAQITFLRALPHLDNLRPTDDGSVYRWLSTIARRVVCDHYRRGPRLVETPVSPTAAFWRSAQAGETPAPDAAVERRALLLAALDAIPADTRRVVELRYLRGLPINDVAQQLGRGRATVVRYAAAGLAALRIQINDAGARAEITFPEEPLR